MTRTGIAAEIADAAATMRRMAEDEAFCAAVERAADMVAGALRGGRKLLLCGNGGSAADAQHWAGEIVARFLYDRPGLPAVALTTDSSVLTAIGNDYGYEHVFARQVEALGQKGDVLFALSTSGRSPNVLAAVRAARARGLATVGFTGRGGGQLAELCDLCLRMPSDHTPRIQEAHELVGHVICRVVEERMFPRQA